MAKNNNLQDFLTDVANAIRTKTQTTEPINAQNFSTEILNIQTGGGENTLKKLLDATSHADYLFYGYFETSADDLIKYSDTENVVSTNRMFYFCTNLTSIPFFDTSKVLDMSEMFYQCQKITTIPQFNTSKTTSMPSAFQGCKQLTIIPALDVSNVTNMNSIFSGCSSLKSILMTGMTVSFKISSSTKFEESDLVTILNNLATVTTTQTLTMGATNLAKLTDEEKAIATNKGWTLA